MEPAVRAQSSSFPPPIIFNTIPPLRRRVSSGLEGRASARYQKGKSLSLRACRNSKFAQPGVHDVMVNGKLVVRDATVLTLNKFQIMQKAAEYGLKVQASLKH